MPDDRQPADAELTRRSFIALLRASHGLSIAGGLFAAAGIVLVVARCNDQHWLAPQLALAGLHLFIGARVALDIRLFEVFLALAEDEREQRLPGVMQTLLGRRLPAGREAPQADPYARERGAVVWLRRQAVVLVLQFVLLIAAAWP